jgi:PAS domain S-box-containing protein
MNRRISLLVATGFALLLTLGVLVSGIMMTGLEQTVLRAQASQASALEVRAAVRSLRADYLQSSDAVSRFMLDPSQHDAVDAKREADANAKQHLASANAATRRGDLKAVLDRLGRHDEAVTNRVEDRLLILATSNPRKAKEVYFRRYLTARALNMSLVQQSLQMASDEVSAASQLTEAEARKTLVLAWAALGLFVVVGATSGIWLSRAVRTITTRFEKAATEVAEQRDHLQAVTTAMRDALMVVDASGIVTTVNGAACALLGWEREALVGSPIERFVHNRPGRSSNPLPAPTGTDEFAYRARDGTHIPISASAATLRDALGRVIGTVWVAHDMREHLRMLGEVAAARDAALEGSRTKSEFLANMSHEIRTPLNIIIGYVDLVIESSELPPEQREHLDRVRASAVALLDIINDVLDISKVEAGKLSIERVPFGLRTVVEDVVGTLRLWADEKGLPLAIEVDARVPDRVTGDPTRLRQVVLNLVSNAIKFTEAGTVLVRVGLERGGGVHGPLLHFSVADTGMGIPRDKQGIIFEAFTQADGSMSRRFGGTGLGLAIAARLVGLMGGRIWVESDVGAGSVFHFTVQMDVDRSPLAA